LIRTAERMGGAVYTEDLVAKQERKEKIYEMMRQGDWRAVCKEFHKEDEYREPLLVWVRPSQACLVWIHQKLTELGINHVSSVGCGCGTFEWLLTTGTGLGVTGYEVNRGWWESPHSTPHFIPLEYVDELDGRFCELPKSSAALFCYFNSLDLFHKYLDNFKGFCVILIGPKDGRRHCEPEPRYLEEECGDTWRLYETFHMMGEDEIAIYVRRGALTGK